MIDSEDGDERPKKVPLQVDLYGIKGDISPRPDRESPPGSWKETAKRVNYHLMRFCESTIGLLADVPAALRSVVRGVARLPGAISSRVQRAHQRADNQLEIGTSSSGREVATVEATLSPDEALEQFRLILDGIRAKGVSVELVRLPTGQWTLGMTEQGIERAALVAARKTINGIEIDASGLIPEIGATTRTEIALMANIPRKALHALRNAGYHFLEELHEAGPEKVAAVPGIGPKSLNIIRAELVLYGQPWRAE